MVLTMIGHMLLDLVYAVIALAVILGGLRLLGFFPRHPGPRQGLRGGAVQGARIVGSQYRQFRDTRFPGPDETQELPVPPPDQPQAAMPAPPRDVPRQAPPQPAPPGGDFAGGGGAQGDVLAGIWSLVAEASAGDLIAVRRVIGTLTAVSDGMRGAWSRLGTRLAEPDKHYGPDIWEPLLQASAQDGSAALHGAQSDAALASLAGTTVGDLAASPRQAPHHSQLNGG